jgi:hypothetical protein
MWWCFAGVLLTVLQPFIAVHFDPDGWEDEPGINIRTATTPTEFELDDDRRDPSVAAFETTLFVPSAASIDLPHALQQGLDGLMALVLLLLPLTVALVPPGEPRQRRSVESVPTRSGAPPPPELPWRRLPPQLAPPE